MITIRDISGVSPKTLEPVAPQTDAPAQHIYDADRVIGMCERRAGGGAVMFRPISEALQREILQALDDRDGEAYPERAFKLSANDKRSTCHVLAR